MRSQRRGSDARKPPKTMPPAAHTMYTVRQMPTTRRHVVQLARGLGREALHDGQRAGIEEEETEAHPHRGDLQEIERTFGGARGRAGAARGSGGTRQLVPLEPQHGDDHEHESAAHSNATRQDQASVIGTSSAGASAQPRLPVMPCTL